MNSMRYSQTSKLQENDREELLGEKSFIVWVVPA